MPRNMLRRPAWCLAVCAACVASALLLDRALLSEPMGLPAVAASARPSVEVEASAPVRREGRNPPAELRGVASTLDMPRSASGRPRRVRSSNVARSFASEHWGRRRLRALAEVLETGPSATIRARVVEEMSRLVTRHRAGIDDDLARLLEARVASLDDPRLAHRLERSLSP